MSETRNPDLASFHHGSHRPGVGRRIAQELPARFTLPPGEIVQTRIMAA
jgi:hypothetical protein